MEFISSSWDIILICSIIAFVSAIVTGFSGFGFALISVPLLSLFVDIKFGVPLVLLVAFFSVVVLSVNKLRFFRERIIYFIFIGMVIGIFVGTYFLANFKTDLLKKLLGLVIILFSLHIFLRARYERVQHRRKMTSGKVGMVIATLVGILSGVAGGMFGTSGPPLVVYVDYFAENKSAFRAQLLVLFVLHDLFRMYLYIRYSLINMEVVRFAVCLLPAVCLGLFIGSRMHFQVNEKIFGRAVATMLLVSGLLLLKP
ncbi:MAG: sulfite exporter TauE/SafE family protein [Candidatus Abyssobacteria bacterium SURF_17]|uniref:Probable membrane transporter protein n=1 Tax=Candidatus Abyssobacteria bacterium SURF_17 TaxID=2093361 RepID=A0A419F6V8_9BACT|nr:MAG: sulfite exporter TauE/SafE family protein [Candidatus Abyssubacteria bacterium SURF_17]